MIKDSITATTWEDGKKWICFCPNMDLLIAQTPEVHAQIGRLLAYLRSLREHRIVVEGTAALVEDALLDEWRVGGPAPAALSDVAVKALDEALAVGRRASLVGSFRCAARNNQRMSASDITAQSYTRSYNSAVGVAVPEVGHLLLGKVMEVCPVTRGDRILCDVRFTRQTGTLPIPSFETGVTGLGPVGLPEASFIDVGTTVTGRSGETILAARVAAPAPKAAAGAPARSLCFFVRPTLVPVKPVPAPDTGGPLQTRLLDVSTFTHRSDWLKARDFEKTNLKIPDEDPNLSFSPTDGVTNIIAREIASETWDMPGICLDYNYGLLVVRHTPAVVDQVVKWVERRAPRHFRRIAMRADLLMTDRGTLQALLEKHPGLKGSSVPVDAEEATLLLGRADKQSGVTRLDSTDVVGVSGQYLTLKRVDRFAYVKGYTTGDLAAPPLPEVDVMTDGFVLECFPALSDDGKTVRAHLEFYGSRPGPSAPEKDESGRRVRRPVAAEAKWSREVTAAGGAASLVDGGLTATVDGEPRRLLLLVRFQPVP